MRKFETLISQTQISEADYDYLYQLSEDAGKPVSEVMRLSIQVYMETPHIMAKEQNGFLCLAPAFMVDNEMEAFISEKRKAISLSQIVRNAMKSLKNKTGVNNVRRRNKNERRYYYTRRKS